MDFSKPSDMRSSHNNRADSRSMNVGTPLTEEMKVLIRRELEYQWSWWRTMEFILLTRYSWIHEDLIILDSTSEKPFGRRLYLPYNKPTAVYCLQSSQGKDGNGKLTLVSEALVGAAFKIWKRCYAMQPHLDYGHFFANLVRIPYNGPSTISGVIQAHKECCKQASARLSMVRKDRQKMYSLLPLYWAIIVIVDREVRDESDEKTLDLVTDRREYLLRYAQIQSVLVVRTGIEEGLSAPISLESLRASSLPLKRMDICANVTDAVRVPLAVAVSFIVDLEKREDMSSPKSRNDLPVEPGLMGFPPDRFDGEDRSSLEAWIESCTRNAEQVGLEKNYFTSDMLKRIEEVRAGKFDYEFDRPHHGWHD